MNHFIMLIQKTGAVQESIPVHDPVACEFRVLEPRNHAENPFLFAEFQPRLEPNKIVEGVSCIVLTKLHNSKRLFASTRIRETNRFHRSEGGHKMLSMGMQPSNTCFSSKPCMGAVSAFSSASMNAAYSDSVMGAFR